MPLSCNVNVNLNNLRGSLETNLNTILNLNLGTPDGLNAIAASIGGAFEDIGSSIANAVDDVIPDISLREELDALSKLAATPIAAAAKIGEIVGDFAEATGLTGFVNLDLTDLSNSVFSANFNFDPCNPSVPNIFRRPDGTLTSKPSVQPNLGLDTLGINNIQTQTINDNVQSILSNNQFLTDNVSNPVSSNINPSDFIKTQESIIQQNVNPSKSGMGDVIRTLASGGQGVESRSSFISRIKENTSLLTEV